MHRIFEQFCSLKSVLIFYVNSLSTNQMVHLHTQLTTAFNIAHIEVTFQMIYRVPGMQHLERPKIFSVYFMGDFQSLVVYGIDKICLKLGLYIIYFNYMWVLSLTSMSFILYTYIYNYICIYMCIIIHL